MAISPSGTPPVVEPFDDPTVSNDDLVVRYIDPRWLIPSNARQRRLSKGAFSGSSQSHDPHKGMSVDVLKLIFEDHRTPSDVMPENFEACVLLNVGKLRQLGLKVAPTPEPGKPYHGSVWGVRKKLRSDILALSKWVIKPDDVI